MTSSGDTLSSNGVVSVTLPIGGDAHLGLDDIAALAATLREIDRDPGTRVILITSARQDFCVGLRRADAERGLRIDYEVRQLVDALLEVEHVTVGVVRGGALGVGFSIALMCDFTIVADDAVLGDPTVLDGGVAASGSAVMLPLLVGPQRAKDFLLTGKTIDGTSAASLGLVARAVGRGRLEDASMELATALADQPVFASTATKVVVNRYVRWMANQVMEVGLAYDALSRQRP